MRFWKAHWDKIIEIFLTIIMSCVVTGIATFYITVGNINHAHYNDISCLRKEFHEKLISYEKRLGNIKSEFSSLMNSVNEQVKPGIRKADENQKDIIIIQKDIESIRHQNDNNRMLIDAIHGIYEKFFNTQEMKVSGCKSDVNAG